MILEDHECRIVIDLERGGRLSSCQIAGWEILECDGVDWFHWGSFALVPWVGRLRNARLAFAGREYRFPPSLPPHALHGLVARQMWRQTSPGTLQADLAEPWPWRGRIIHEIKICPDQIEFRLVLDADEEMPAAIGWHPWFSRVIEGPSGRRSDPLLLRASPQFMYENDENGLPTGSLVPPVERPWDYCFRDMEEPPVVIWPGALELSVESSHQDWIIYDKEPQAICVEPVTGPPNSINMPNPFVVARDRPLIATMTWRWRELS